MRDIEHQETGVDVPCNQSVSKTVLTLLCKRNKQRDERHNIKHLWCRLKDLANGDQQPLLVVNCGGMLNPEPLIIRLGVPYRYALRLPPLTPFGLVTKKQNSRLRHGSNPVVHFLQEQTQTG